MLADKYKLSCLKMENKEVDTQIDPVYDPVRLSAAMLHFLPLLVSFSIYYKPFKVASLSKICFFA